MSCSYPPPHNGSTPSYASPNVDQPAGFMKPNVDTDVNVIVREISRTPSPTPTEVSALNAKGGIRGLINRIRNFRAWLTLKNLPYILAASLLAIIIILFGVYNRNIVSFLQPPADKIKDQPAGFLIFVAILFVISFPPLFGHEIVGAVIGLAYGLWPGFGVVCAGTFLGEIANYFVFRYWCKARGEKLERDNIRYGAFAKVVREGGWKIAPIARLSAIPAHFTTTVFATCGLNIFIFIGAVIFALPKQLVVVYIGVTLGEEVNGTESTQEKNISHIALGVTIVITLVALEYINRKIRAAIPAVVYARRKRRQARLEQAGDMGSMYPSSSSLDPNGVPGSIIIPFNLQAFESEVPLTAGGQHQKCGTKGHASAAGYSGDISASV